MRFYLVSRGESLTVCLVPEGEITEGVLVELTQPGFEEMGKLIARQPDHAKWETVLEMMLREVLKRGLKAGAAQMCGKIMGSVDEAHREEFDDIAKGLLNEVMLEIGEAHRHPVTIAVLRDEDEPKEK